MTLKEAIALVNASGTHVVVPVEPTDEMIDAARRQPVFGGQMAGAGSSDIEEAYKLMLSASLTHSEGGE